MRPLPPLPPAAARPRPPPPPPPPPTTRVPRLEAERLKELARLEREHLELLTRLPKGFEEHWTNGEEDPTEGIMYYYNPTSMGEPVWEAPQISPEDEQPDDEAELGGPNFDELMARQADLDKEPIDEPPPPVEIEAVEIDAGAAADQAAAEEALKEMAVVDSPFSEEEKVALVKHLNWALGEAGGAPDEHVGARLPLNPHTDSWLEALPDGLPLSKFVMHVDPRRWTRAPSTSRRTERRCPTRALQVTPRRRHCRLHHHLHRSRHRRRLASSAASNLQPTRPVAAPQSSLLTLPTLPCRQRQVVLQLMWNLTRNELLRR